jgi:predicted ribosomally synthesized peptide with SipW-like signal peptide
MKKILMSLLVIALAVGGVAGASGAWFSDTEETVGNTFTAGIIDISLNPQVGQEAVSIEGDLDLKPCMTGYIKVRVTNDGNNPVEVWKHIKDVENDENGITDAEGKEYDAWEQGSGLPNPADMNISDYIMYDMWIDHGCVEDNNNTNGAEADFVFDPGVDRMIMAEADGFTVTPGPDTPGVECWYIYLGVLDPGESMVVIQSYHLMSWVTNWAQSDKMTFTMEFFGQQTQGTPQPDPPQPNLDTGSNGELPGWGRADAPPYPCDWECDDGQCNDGVYCNGEETCVRGICMDGDPPVCEDPYPICSNELETCVQCTEAADCEDDLFCTGVESCTAEGNCESSGDPCEGAPGSYCYEDADACLECMDNTDCDILYPDENRICVDGTCQP